MSKNYPFEILANLQNWIEEHYPNTNELQEKLRELHGVEEAIKQLEKLNLPISDGVFKRKKEIERFTEMPYEKRNVLLDIEKELKIILTIIKKKLNFKITTSVTGASLSRSKKLKVIFPDNTVFNEAHATDTFIKVLQHIGLSRISELREISTLWHPLVATQKNKFSRQAHQVEGYFIETNLSTKHKAEFIKRIADALDITGISIEVLE